MGNFMVVYCCFYLHVVMFTSCVMLFSACTVQLQISVNPNRKTVYNTCGDYFVFVERYCSKETNLLQRNRYIGKGKPRPPPPPPPPPPKNKDR